MLILKDFVHIFFGPLIDGIISMSVVFRWLVGLLLSGCS